jgi:RNA polymerase sigma-70 factor (ECF subfamily)
MRLTTLLLVVGTTLGLSAEPVSQNPAKEDTAKLQGAWAIVSVEVEGQPLAMDKLKDARLTIQGKEYSFRLGEMRLELTYQLDPGKSPKAIDLILVEGADKGKSYRGIYTLEKDRYKICRTTEPEKGRPTEFATRPKSGLMMVVWKRANPAGAK